MKDDLLDVLNEVLKPKVILLRNDNSIRGLERLSRYVELPLAEAPWRVRLSEYCAIFDAPVRDGQKTDWYFDQRDNRARLRNWVKGKRVLDAFSYIGALGDTRGAGGRRAGDDESGPAPEYARHSAQLNGVDNGFETREGDVSGCCKSCTRARSASIILDPPAFIKRRRGIKQGTLAYRRLNEFPVRVLGRDALLVSCSCSYHPSLHQLVAQIHQAARHLDRDLQILSLGGQGPDHPLHLAIPETAYLKVVFMRLTRWSAAAAVPSRTVLR